MPPGHVDELSEVMAGSRNWQLNKTLIHVIDREADSVGHYRAWAAKGHRFLVRADDDRWVLWNGTACQLKDVIRGLSLTFRDVPNETGEPAVVTIAAGTGRIRVAQAEVVLHRPAKTVVPGVTTARGHKKQIEVPGVPLPLRLVVTRAVNEMGTVIAAWCLLTNVSPGEASAAVVGRWYAWRWRIETYHKLLKTAGIRLDA